MAFIVTAIAGTSTLALAGGALLATTAASLYTANQTKQQAKGQRYQARQDALLDQKNARKAAVFAETEGAGLGQIGQISLEVDDELDPEENLRSNISI